jgi:uncharacterized LabA/DUF88 family protein
MPKALILADTVNIYRNVKHKFQKKLEYSVYMQHCRRWAEEITAYAYGNSVGDSTDFQIYLTHCGFNPVFRDGENGWYIQVCVDAFRFMNNADILILGTGDPAYVPLIDFVRMQGKRVIVFACNIHPSMKAAADEYFEINTNLLERIDNVKASLGT